MGLPFSAVPLLLFHGPTMARLRLPQYIISNLANIASALRYAARAFLESSSNKRAYPASSIAAHLRLSLCVLLLGASERHQAPYVERVRDELQNASALHVGKTGNDEGRLVHTHQAAVGACRATRQGEYCTAGEA